jgi:hypothetical protein
MITTPCPPPLPADSSCASLRPEQVHGGRPRTVTALPRTAG